jgi:hypothetical protein
MKIEMIALDYQRKEISHFKSSGLEKIKMDSKKPIEYTFSFLKYIEEYVTKTRGKVLSANNQVFYVQIE